MVVAATNICIYCFLVDLPVGHTYRNGPSKQMLMNRPYIEDAIPYNEDNLCLFKCVVKRLRPNENQEIREKRVKLMWAIMRATEYKEVNSESVIKLTDR